MKSSTVVNVTGVSLVTLGIAAGVMFGVGCRDFASDMNRNNASTRTSFVESDKVSILYGSVPDDIDIDSWLGS